MCRIYNNNHVNVTAIKNSSYSDSNAIIYPVFDYMRYLRGN